MMQEKALQMSDSLDSDSHGLSADEGRFLRQFYFSFLWNSRSRLQSAPNYGPQEMLSLPLPDLSAMDLSSGSIILDSEGETRFRRLLESGAPIKEWASVLRNE